jgi:hypothetical protein
MELLVDTGQKVPALFFANEYKGLSNQTGEPILWIS